MKKSSVQTEPKGVESGSNDGNDYDGYEDQEVVDMSLLLEKKRNKILEEEKKHRHRSLREEDRE